MSTHIVNVAFDFDDDKVRKTLEDTAYNAVIKDIKEDIMKAVIDNPYKKGEGMFKEKLRYMVQDSIDSMLEDYKPEIIEAAAEKLAEKFSRTKAFKDKMKEAMEGGVNDAGEVQ